MSGRKNNKSWWILTFNQRKFLSRKFKKTQAEIQYCKDNGDWNCVMHLQSLLRRVWWGIKRYKNK